MSVIGLLVGASIRTGKKKARRRYRDFRDWERRKSRKRRKKSSGW